MRIALVVIAVIATINLISTAYLWNTRVNESLKVNNRLIQIQQAEQRIEERLTERSDLIQEYNALLAETNALVDKNNALVAENSKMYRTLANTLGE